MVRHGGASVLNAKRNNSMFDIGFTAEQAIGKYNDEYQAVVQREMNPFKVFLNSTEFKGDSIEKNKFVKWVKECFAPYIASRILFWNDKSELCVECVDGNAALTKGDVIVSKFPSEHVYMRLNGCSLPYRVNKTEFFRTYRLATNDEGKNCEDPYYLGN